MKLTILLFSLLYFECIVSGQERTTLSELGKVGRLHFTLAKSDTANSVSITQNQSLFGAGDIKIVVVAESEISEVVKALSAFAEETGKKAANNTVITYKTKNLLLSCSYFKAVGWSIIIQNTDPAFDQDSEKVKQRTGYQINNFVEIKPDQIQEVVKLFSKVMGSKAA